MKTSVDYIKIMVIELDPFCESQIVADVNCKPDEVAGVKEDLRDTYSDDNLFLTVEQKMSIMI